MTVEELFSEFGYTPQGPLAEAQYELVIENQDEEPEQKFRPLVIRFDHLDRRVVIEVEEIL